jgi:DNA-binding beta-propeller fold protein YncE
MRLRRHFELRGDFSFDAISPDGRTAYLIEYLSPNDQTKYAVRAYDMRARRLFRAPVVDKSQPGEDMSGVPLVRVSDSEGRWAYTLYSAAEHPFVHALDTERRTAVCIDLDNFRNLGGVNLDLSGKRLTVSNNGGTLAVIDTSTHSVISSRKRNGAPAAVARDTAGTPWLLVAAPTAALLLLLAAVGRRRRATAAAR